jgi:hypothetical protein
MINVSLSLADLTKALDQLRGWWIKARADNAGEVLRLNDRHYCPKCVHRLTRKNGNPDKAYIGGVPLAEQGLPDYWWHCSNCDGHYRPR